MNLMMRSGWFYSLSKGSNWGSPEGLARALEPTNDPSVLRIDSEVWGKPLRKGQVPKPGDGLAFYHSSRAEFPRPDAHKRQPRVSLVGIVESFESLGDGDWQLSVLVSRVVAVALPQNPVVRDELTAGAFARSGLGTGPFASFYPVSPKDWALFSSWVAARLPQRSQARFLRAQSGTEAVRDAPVSPVEETAGDFDEGALQRRLVNQYERSAAARRRCIEYWGERCFVCGPRAKETYGYLGAGIVEVHHTMPLARRREAYTVDPVRDLKPLCPTCHAVIHRTEKPISVETLARLVRRRLDFRPA